MGYPADAGDPVRRNYGSRRNCIKWLQLNLIWFAWNKKLSHRWQTAWLVSRSVKVIRHGTIPYVGYGFLLVRYSINASINVTDW